TARPRGRPERTRPVIYMEGRGEKQGLEIRLRDDDRRTGEIVGEIVFWDDDGRRRLQLGMGHEDADERKPMGIVIFDVDENGRGEEVVRLKRPSAPPLVMEATTTPEDTLRAAGISTKRQARYQRR